MIVFAAWLKEQISQETPLEKLVKFIDLQPFAEMRFLPFTSH